MGSWHIVANGWIGLSAQGLTGISANSTYWDSCASIGSGNAGHFWINGGTLLPSYTSSDKYGYSVGQKT